MYKEEANILVDSLKKHSGIIPPNSEMFFDILVNAYIPKSSRFYESLPDKQQLLEETNRYHYLSLRRVLRNRNARNYQLSGLKQAYEAIASALKIYSSDVLSRRLRADKELVEMMAESRHPFSLLGKFQTYDYDNPDERLFIETRPVLVIPDAKDITKILKWEEANIVREEEVWPFRHRIKIKPQEYFSANF